METKGNEISTHIRILILAILLTSAPVSAQEVNKSTPYTPYTPYTPLPPLTQPPGVHNDPSDPKNQPCPWDKPGCPGYEAPNATNTTQTGEKK